MALIPLVPFPDQTHYEPVLRVFGYQLLFGRFLSLGAPSVLPPMLPGLVTCVSSVYHSIAPGLVVVSGKIVSGPVTSSVSDPVTVI